MAPSDSHDRDSVAQRLRVARQAARLSTRAVSSELRARGFDVSHATLANYERHRAIPSVPILRGLATVYGCSVKWLLGETDSPPLCFSEARYRCLKSVRVSERAAYEREAARLASAYLFVERVLGRQMPLTQIEIAPPDSGKQVAAKIRAELQLGDHPIPSLIRLLTEFGVRAIAVDTESRIDGFAARFGCHPFVVLNTGIPNDRLRMNAAHELAHHLFEDSVSVGSLSEKDTETRAFECASHLLIPDDMLRKAFELRSMVRLVEFKMRFGISLAAMIYRANQSRLIPRSMYERLWRDFSRLGWRKQEPGRVAPDRPTRLEALIDAAVRSRKTSYEEIAEVSGLDELAIRERVFVAMGGSDEPFPDDSDSPILRVQRDEE